MISELKSQVGKQANEVGKYRQFFDLKQQEEISLRLQLQQQQQAKNQPPQGPISAQDLLAMQLNSPDKYNEHVINQVLNRISANAQQQTVAQIRDQNIQTIQSPEFIDWANKNVPPSIGNAALRDPAQLNFVLNTFKTHQASQQPRANIEQKPVGVAAGIPATSRTPAGKIWSRNEIMEMNSKNPSEYQRNIPEIERAYAEGRVRQ